MAKADLGTKRACLSCGMRFYDFKRSPILCPGCGAEFDPENIVKNRKSRLTSKAANAAGKNASDDDQVETDDNDALAKTIVVGKDDDDDDIPAEIKAMIEKKDELSVEETVENIVEEVKEELSSVEKVNHNPEASADKALNLYSKKGGTTTMDIVLQKINKFKN